MALTIQVDGLATIKIASPSSGTLETLGYTINGAEITEQVFADDIPGDENGGDLGPPIDVQNFGELHIIRLLMTKWDEVVLNKVRAVVAGGTAGVVPTPGGLYFQGNLAWRLLIHSPNRPRNYLLALFREPKEINKGTKHSRQLVVATAYMPAGGGVLYNAVLT